MVKAYLRYEQASPVLGLVVSADSNVSFDRSAKLLLAGALENLMVWNLKQGRCLHALAPAPSSSSSSMKPAVTSIACMPTSISMVCTVKAPYVCIYSFLSV
jgi:U3 small nucleolar RNA-associated protein 12